MSHTPPCRLPGTPRPLYVDPDTEIRLTLEDESIGIRHPERAETTVPLRHVSRLIVPEQTDIEFALLCACAHRGIPVVVIDREGSPSLRCIGSYAGDPGFRQRLVDFTTRADWQERFEDWYDGQRSRIARTLSWRIRLCRNITSSREIRKTLETTIAREIGPEAEERSRRTFQSMALAEMQQNLTRAGIDARNDVWLNDLIDLGARLGELLRFDLEAIRLRAVQQWARKRAERSSRVDGPPHRYLVASLERERSHLEKQARELITRLHRHLIEIS